jgi:hypothetical protein
MPRRNATISDVAFDCPHCGAYASQTWFVVYVIGLSGEVRTPTIVTPEALEPIRANKGLPEEARDNLIRFIEKCISGLVFLEELKGGGKYSNQSVHNLNLSRCFACNEIAVWVHERLLFPGASAAPAPNPDLPEAVRLDYDEAGRIVNLSPRGAAAFFDCRFRNCAPYWVSQGDLPPRNWTVCDLRT